MNLEDHEIAPLLQTVLEQSVLRGASDVHVSPGEPIHFRIDGQLSSETFDGFADNKVSDEQTISFASSLLTSAQHDSLEQRGSFDGAFSIGASNRFRFNAYKKNGSICFAFRFLANTIPELDQLGLDSQLYELCNLKDGLILVAGPTGSGKSTTIASLIDRINRNRRCHIITIEDPVEFVHPSKMALVNQRQIGPDVETFSQALHDAVRQDPDVILVGELRDLDTMRTAISAAETGHLVFASVHAGDCKTAIERLVGAFAAEEQNLAQRLVATVLRTVIVQHLLPRMQNPNLETEQSSRRVLASEVMHANSAISNLIATGRLNQINSIIQTSGEEGMWTIDDSLASLWRSRLITERTARSLARDPDTMVQTKRRSRA
ncbi:type IV pilus twitching motility protein PilT [Mariniblastus fucicola]|uniref:Twitching mobility protein n=1 Tax=Mariniblastus fucicola TaxID=980251 RepID=A0A5B9PDT9_9BACT|nr:PilT/PilU family type 4a pilus ATPase [Mariniblastus fucicola]QEG23102.1 Twitching mobility protein [Mariniblastus fucicola]